MRHIWRNKASAASPRERPVSIKRVAAEIFQNLVAHWVTLLLIAGVSIALPFWGRLSEQWPWPVAVIAAVLLFAAGFSIYRGWPLRRYAKAAQLSLTIHADARQPSRISAKNVGRWFLLREIGIGPNVNGNMQHVVIHTILFITFDPWILVGSLQVNGRNMLLPPYTTPKVDSDAAIIVFDGALQPGELEINID